MFGECFLFKKQNNFFKGKNHLMEIFRLPFELNSAKRFMGVNIVQSMSCWTGTTILITIVSMYFGIILYIQAFLKDFEFYFDEMDTFAENENLPALNSKFETLIKFHVYILEYVNFCVNSNFLTNLIFSLSERLGDMMKMVIFVTFTPCIVSICGSLLRGQSVRFLFVVYNIPLF